MGHSWNTDHKCGAGQLLQEDTIDDRSDNTGGTKAQNLVRLAAIIVIASPLLQDSLVLSNCSYRMSISKMTSATDAKQLWQC